jgi:hypothetical protein
MMEELLNRLYPSAPGCDPNTDPHFANDAPFQLVGGSVMTAGGYASRVFRFDVLDAPEYHLEPEIKVRGTSADDEQVSVWRVRPIKSPAAGRTPATFPVWLRWQLNQENLAGLLAATRKLERTAEPTATGSGQGPVGAAGVELNLEYLNNRVNDLGQINGKARYRAKLPFSVGDDGADGTNGDLADLDTAFRQALHVSLQRDLRARLTSSSTYLLVSDEEPRRPASSEGRESEFNSY